MNAPVRRWGGGVGSLAGLLLVVTLAASPAAAAGPPHLFPQEQCDSCHLSATREGTYLRPSLFRGDVNTLCFTCHERERTGVGHRVGMVASMKVPEDFPLDSNGRLTCATCHDPHAVEGPFPDLLRRPPGKAFCDLCHGDTIPEAEPSPVTIVFPPDGAVLPPGETVVAGTVASHEVGEVTVSAGARTVTAPVVRGSFAARVRLGRGANVVEVAAGRSRARSAVTGRAGGRGWRPHLTADLGQCRTCHPGWEERGFFVAGTVGEACTGCHGRQDRLPHTHRPSAIGECTACHDPHGGGRGLIAGDRGGVCTRCHDRDKAARHVVDANAGLPAPAIECADCHDPHQSTRPDLATGGAATLVVPIRLDAPEPSGWDPTALPGYSFTDDPGRPRLPERIIALAVPPGADPGSARLRVVSADRVVLPGRHEVRPAPPAASWAGGRPLVEWGRGRTIRDGRDEKVYGADAPWPREPVTLERGGEHRGLGLVRVAFRPLQVNPVQGTLTLTRRVVAEVTFSPAKAARRVARPSGRRAGAATRVSAADLGVVNAPLAGTVLASAAAGGETTATSVDAVAPSAGTADYVIVTTRATAAASAQLQAFAVHKAARGLAVRVVTEDEYGSAATGQARAVAIRAWLKANYASLGIRYVLLAGDPNPETGDVPMLRAWPRRGATTNTSYLDAPTDAFYADLTGNWDLDGNGYYGEYATDGGAGGVDFVPEVFVGRIPVYAGAVADLDAVLAKTMAYENEPGDLAWRRSVLLPMSFSDAGTDGAWLGEQMKGDFLVGRGFTPWTLYQQGSLAAGGDSVHDSDEELRGGAVQARWGATPFGVVAWWGHGSASRAMVGYTGAWDGDILANSTTGLPEAAPAFVWQTACLNGYPEIADNLGFALLKRGAVATVAASRVSWYFIGQRDFRASASNAGLGYQYVSRLTAGESAGKALALAKGDPTVSKAGNTLWMNLMDFNLYGDPSVSLFRGPLLSPSPAALSFTAAEGEAEALSGGLALAAGDATVAFTAVPGAGWVAVAPAAGTTPAVLTIGVNPAALTPGTHEGVVTVAGQGAGNSPLSVPVSLRVTRAGGISGRVLSAAGAGVPGASVTLQGPRSRLAVTDAGGAYAFSPLPPGTYTVSVSGTGYAFSPATRAVELAEGATSTVDFTGGTLEIRGRVVKAGNGAPIAKVVVQLRTASGVVLKQVTTKSDGTYVIPKVAPGSYKVKAKLAPWTFSPAPAAVSLSAGGAPATLDFRGKK